MTSLEVILSDEWTKNISESSFNLTKPFFGLEHCFVGMGVNFENVIKFWKSEAFFLSPDFFSDFKYCALKDFGRRGLRISFQFDVGKYSQKKIIFLRALELLVFSH